MKMNESDKKFLDSRQETLRLEIALNRYFETTDPEMKRVYEEYLQKRFRPAMEKLIRSRENGKVRQLLLLKNVTLFQIEEFLSMAREAGNTEGLLFLLQKKEELFGFKGKDMEL